MDRIVLVQRRIDGNNNSKYTFIIAKVHIKFIYIKENIYIYFFLTIVFYRSNVAIVESEMSTDSTRDSTKSMSPPLGDDRFTPGSSGEQQRHLSTDSTRDSGIDPDDPQKSSLAAYLPCITIIFLYFFYIKHFSI